MNNFPISVSQIAEGMNNAASMMANAGMDFDQSVALLTAANTTVQNISKSSTALRTIIARLRNVKSELDDAGEVWNEAKYQELVSALTDGGVQLQEATGALRNPYDVLSELAAKWSTMSSDVRAAITTALAGTRQQDVFSSLMSQFGEATGAMEAMQDSAGALDSAYGIFEESMQGHINKLKAAFEELSMTAVDSGFVNNLVDLGTQLIEVFTPVLGFIGKITSALGPLGTALTAIGAIGIGKNLGKQFALYRRKPVLHKPSNCGETLTPLCYNVVLTDKRDSRRKAERNSGWPMLNNNAKGCMTMSNPQPSPSPLPGLHRVGICDEREGSQTVRRFALAAA